MTPFTTITSKAIALPTASIDTDIIYPARFLLITEKAGLGQYAFYEWRHERTDTPLTDPAFADAAIIVAGDNFGCGSSREQAPWALSGMGIRTVVSTSFGEIFYNNCFKNGMLPVVVTEPELARLLEDAANGQSITVDLTTCQVSTGATTIPFTVAGWQRDMLLSGQDEIATIIARDAAAITRFETNQRRTQPWLWPA